MAAQNTDLRNELEEFAKTDEFVRHGLEEKKERVKGL